MEGRNEGLSIHGEDDRKQYGKGVKEYAALETDCASYCIPNRSGADLLNEMLLAFCPESQFANRKRTSTAAATFC